MPTEETNPPTYLVRFSSFELDLRAGELRKHGVRIKLQDQPLQILALLLEKPGEVVTREQLRDRLWPADTFVDFDHSLNSAVKKLRQALNDDPDVPRFIETLPRRGYRFIAEVRNDVRNDSVRNDSVRNGSQPASSATEKESAPNGGSAASIPAAPAAAAAAPPARSHHWKLWLAGAFGFVLALGLVYWFRPPLPARSRSTEAIRLVPLTTFSGEFSKGSFSPDGNEIAYAWEGDQEDHGVDIYVKQLGVEKPFRSRTISGSTSFPSGPRTAATSRFCTPNQASSPAFS